MNEQEVRDIMALDWVATASDGRAEVPNADRPHPRSYGTFSRKIGFYSLKEKIIPLESAVGGTTGLPADILGLSDLERLRAKPATKDEEKPADPLPRGYLKPGFAADVTVFRPDKFIDMATFDEPHRYSGITICLRQWHPCGLRGNADCGLVRSLVAESFQSVRRSACVSANFVGTHRFFAGQS